MVMIIVSIAILGLIFGSFVNALVWRVHEQELENEKKRPNKNRLAKLSISRGRSVCPNCDHELGVLDLVPVFSWVYLRGKCRYCHTPISYQYPFVELITAALFVTSYVCWPLSFGGRLAVLQFAAWLILLVGYVALTVYDLRWMLLPNRILFPLYAPGVLIAAIAIHGSSAPIHASLMAVFAVIIGGGAFFLLFQVSQGKWIGGGDVKLGWLLGLVAATPARSLLVIFIAALLGTIVSLGLMTLKRVDRKAMIPFGPFLIAGSFTVQLWGDSILHWYRTVLGI